MHAETPQQNKSSGPVRANKQILASVLKVLAPTPRELYYEVS